LASLRGPWEQSFVGRNDLQLCALEQHEANGDKAICLLIIYAWFSKSCRLFLCWYRSE
jgi:hypothetical protein